MKILLTDMDSLRTAEIVVSPRMMVEELSPLIKVNLMLPVTDHGWHRFLCRGRVLMSDGMICAYDDFMGECYESWNEPRYGDSDVIPVKRLFTTIGSGCIYEQDNDQRVCRIRLTLLEHRLEVH